jgi:hypothetical protein
LGEEAGMSETAASLGTTYSLTVRVPQLVGIGVNAARREHHFARARRVKRERADVALVLSQFQAPATAFGPDARVVVTLTRCAPGKIDSDGAVHAMKGVRDEVARWMDMDDGDERIEWIVERKKVPRKDRGTVIRVEAWRAEARRA